MPHKKVLHGRTIGAYILEMITDEKTLSYCVRVRHKKPGAPYFFTAEFRYQKNKDVSGVPDDSHRAAAIRCYREQEAMLEAIR